MQHFVDPVDEDHNLPCGICDKIIKKNNKYITCNICNFRIHIKCNQTDVKTYEKMKQIEQTMICIKCNENNLPFIKTSQQINNDTFFYLTI